MSSDVIMPPRPDWRRHALFLDFDGTLAPIVHRPADAAASPETRRAVRRIAEMTGGALAILSGRDLDDLDARLAPLVLPAAGTHGVVRRDAEGRLHRDASAGARFDDAAGRVEAFAHRNGLLVERKSGAVALHYRAAPELAVHARRFIDDIVAAGPELRSIHGNMVSEVVIPAADKGRALAAFMKEPPFAGRVPLMAGDDMTDEDAFFAAQRLGGSGLKIGPGETAAMYSLPDIEAFHDWLHKVAEDGPAEDAAAEWPDSG